MRRSLTGPAPQSALAAAALAVVCATCGWALAQHSRLLLLLPILVALAALLLVFASVGITALWVWAPLAVVTYPFGGPNANITFSRFWIPGLVVLLVLIADERRSARASHRVLWALVLLAAVFGVRTALTGGTRGEYAYGFRVWIDSLLLPLIIFAVVRRVVAAKEGAAERIALSLMIAGLLLAVIGIGETIFGFQLASSIRGGSVFFDTSINQVRISGPYESPAPYGLALVLCLAATLYWILMRPRAPDTLLLALGVAALQFTAIFLNFFRVGWISAILVIVCSIGLRRGRALRLLVVVGTVALVGALAFTQLQSRSAISTRVDNSQNIYARLGAYEQAFEIFRTQPVFGIGALRYNTVASQLPPLVVDGVQSVPDPHDSFLEVLAEDGVIGFIALLWVAIAIGRLVHDFRDNATTSSDAVLGGALMGAVTAYLIYSLTLEMLPYGPSNQFFAVILGLAAGRLDREVRLHRHGPLGRRPGEVCRRAVRRAAKQRFYHTGRHVAASSSPPSG